MKRFLPWILLTLTALTFIVTHALWLADMPERMATHFDAAGKANGWMTRQKHGVFMLLTGLGVPGFILVLSWAMRFISPALLNVPRPQYWRAPENYPTACAILMRWGQWQAAGLWVWMTFLNRQIVLANQISPPRLPLAANLPLMLSLLAAEAALLLWLFWRFRQTDSQAALPSSTSV